MSERIPEKSDATTIPRITARAFLHEMSAEALDLDRGLLHTFVSLCRSPGKTMRRWIVQRDPRLTRPFRYFLIMVALAVLLQSLAGLSNHALPNRSDVSSGESASLQQAGSAGKIVGGTDQIANAVRFLRAEHREVLMLLLIPFIAFGLWCTNRREKWYFAEYWVALTYAYAHSYLFQTLVETVLAPITDQHLLISRITLFGLLITMLVGLHGRPLPGALLRTLTGLVIATFCLFGFIIALAISLTATTQFLQA